MSFAGGKIWCETVEDLSVGTELVAIFTSGSRPADPEKSGNLIKQEPTTPSVEEEVNKRETLIGGKSDAKPTKQLPPQPGMFYCKYIFVSD